jgi:hypothetical protein
MRHCVQCSKPLVDAKGNPQYDRITCGDACRLKDRKEKLVAKRGKQRSEAVRRAKAEIRRICKGCPNRSERCQ